MGRFHRCERAETMILDDSSGELARYTASGRGSFRVSFILQAVAVGNHRVAAVTIDRSRAMVERAAATLIVTANDDPVASVTPSRS